MKKKQQDIEEIKKTIAASGESHGKLEEVLRESVAKKEQMSADYRGFFQKQEEISKRCNDLDKEIFRLNNQREKLKEAGFDVTQATVSRDIRELKLTKVPTGNGRQKYTILVHSDHYLSDKYIRVLKDGYVSMDVAQNILVVKTVSGMAMAVAAAIDAIKLKEIVGCIAGDDTIMCAVRTVPDTIHLMKKIESILND